MSNRLAEIQERLSKATPGPWKVYPYPPYGYGNPAEQRCMNIIDSNFDEIGFVTKDDADFLVHVPEDIRFLLDEIKKLQGTE